MKTDIRSQVLGVLALTSCALFFGSCTERPAEITWSDPGFTEAYFDRKQLDELSDDSKMEYFHFYNVLPERDAEVGSVMAMGAYGDHKEVYSYIGGPWYRMYESLSGTRTICDRLTSDGAEEKVSHLRRAGLTPYAAVFTRKEVFTQALHLDLNLADFLEQFDDIAEPLVFGAVGVEFGQQGMCSRLALQVPLALDESEHGEFILLGSAIFGMGDGQIAHQ